MTRGYLAAAGYAGGLTQRGDFGIVVQGYGAAGTSLAEHLARQAAVWDRLRRPGADSLELAAYPAGTLVKAPGGSVRSHSGTATMAAWR